MTEHAIVEKETTYKSLNVTGVGSVEVTGESEQTQYECSCDEVFESMDEAIEHAMPHPVSTVIDEHDYYTVVDDSQLTGNDGSCVNFIDITAAGLSNRKLGVGLFDAVRSTGWRVSATLYDPDNSSADFRVWVRGRDGEPKGLSRLRT